MHPTWCPPWWACSLPRVFLQVSACSSVVTCGYCAMGSSLQQLVFLAVRNVSASMMMTVAGPNACTDCISDQSLHRTLHVHIAEFFCFSLYLCGICWSVGVLCVLVSLRQAKCSVDRVLYRFIPPRCNIKLNEKAWLRYISQLNTNFSYKIT